LEMVIEQYDGLVASIAYEFSRKFHMVETNDIRQELWIWFLEHPNKVKTWEALEGKQVIKLIARSLRNAAKDFCQKEKAQVVGYRVEDNYYYDKELVELLLPAVFSGSRKPPVINELGYVNARKVLSEGNNWSAMCADVENAFSKLHEEQQFILDTRYGEGLEIGVLSEQLSISQDAARMRINRAMSNLLNLLGGKKPNKERDYKDGEAMPLVDSDVCEQPTQTSAAALSVADGDIA